MSGSLDAAERDLHAGRESYSAVWVGLGGYSENASALEQIGTDADCSRSGAAVLRRVVRAAARRDR